MKNRFMIGDYVQYWIGRDGLVDMYSDITRVCGVSNIGITVEGDTFIPLENVRRVELTPSVLRRLAKKFVYCTALISFNEPYISYTPSLKYLCIINNGVEVRVGCVYLDQMQHLVGEICENYELKLKDYE